MLNYHHDSNNMYGFFSIPQFYSSELNLPGEIIGLIEHCFYDWRMPNQYFKQEELLDVTPYHGRHKNSLNFFLMPYKEINKNNYHRLMRNTCNTQI